MVMEVRTRLATAHGKERAFFLFERTYLRIPSCTYSYWQAPARSGSGTVGTAKRKRVSLFLGATLYLPNTPAQRRLTIRSMATTCLSTQTQPFCCASSVHLRSKQHSLGVEPSPSHPITSHPITPHPTLPPAETPQSEVLVRIWALPLISSPRRRIGI
ncbi:hypothetical protein LY76DRAFT_236232 [Colletotrichum caudatum]|nr:hypothetical protein LY76DRAFT_236232 [Colletotrichum caudatum]